MRSKRVLILDEQAEINAVSRFFGQFEHGYAYEVLGASNAADAVSALRRGRPDLVVLDPQLKGLDGLQLVKQIRGAERTIPVIVVTGTQKTRDAAELLRAEVFAYIPKPCDFTLFEHLVALALSEAPNRRPV